MDFYTKSNFYKYNYINKKKVEIKVYYLFLKYHKVYFEYYIFFLIL